MITSLRLVDFKNFADETLRVGPFTVIVGTNASGKSNIRDAFRFLHGIGRGYTLAEIVGGKSGGGRQEWEPIRGAPTDVVRFRQPGIILEVELLHDGAATRYTIEIEFDPSADRPLQVSKEELVVGSEWRYHLTGRAGDEGVLRVSNSDKRIPVPRDRPALPQIDRHEWLTPPDRIHVKRALDTFANMRFLDLAPDRMRRPSLPSQAMLGDRGENLPTVLQAICADPQRKRILMSWIDELSPAGVRDLEFRAGPFGDKMELGIREANGLTVSADGASGGTLRLLGLLAALLGANPAKLYFFEEIENRIHPTRLGLLIQLIENWTAKEDIQVVTTTHSPTLLRWAGDDTFEYMSVVWHEHHSDLPEGADGQATATIHSVADLPNARELRKSQGIDRLHLSGWMETMLAFTQSGEEEAAQ